MSAQTGKFSTWLVVGNPMWDNCGIVNSLFFIQHVRRHTIQSLNCITMKIATHITFHLAS